VPEEVANRPKAAAQHGAGIHDVIRSLAQDRGFFLQVAQSCRFSAAESVAEVLGSSSRYGYRYGEPELWEPEDHVQLYLDYVCWKAGLLTDLEWRRLQPALEAASATVTVNK
jgi:asparagine synthase (glutamine-hydrolysing)